MQLEHSMAPRLNAHFLLALLTSRHVPAPLSLLALLTPAVAPHTAARPPGLQLQPPTSQQLAPAGAASWQLPALLGIARPWPPAACSEISATALAAAAQAGGGSATRCKLKDRPLCSCRSKWALLPGSTLLKLLVLLPASARQAAPAAQRAARRPRPYPCSCLASAALLIMYLTYKHPSVFACKGFSVHV